TVEQLAVERHRAGAARVEGRPGENAEPHHRLGELEVGQADAVAPPSAVHDDHHDLAVAALAYPGARVTRCELLWEEVFACSPDSSTVPDGDRAAPEGIQDPLPRPVWRHRELRVDDRARRCLGRELWRLRADREQNRA